MTNACAYLLRAAKDAQAYFDQQRESERTLASMARHHDLSNAILLVEREATRLRDQQNAAQFEARR